MRICNQTAFLETIAVPMGGGVSAYGSMSVASGSCTNFAVEIGAIGTSAAVNITGG